MSDPLEIPDFSTPDQFAAICHALAMKLHSKNRTLMGESSFAAEIAKVIERAGTAFGEHYSDPDTTAAFGTGYVAGTLKRNEKPAALFDLLYPSKMGR